MSIRYLPHYVERAKQSLVALTVAAVIAVVIAPPAIRTTVPALDALLADARQSPPYARGAVGLIIAMLALRWLAARELARVRGYGFRFLPPWGLLPQLNAPKNPHWASYFEIFRHLLWRPGKLLLGRMTREQRLFGIITRRRLGTSFEGNILTVAAPGSGKARSAIVPNLIEYPGSCLVIDVKGELARITAGKRGYGDATLAGSRVKRPLGQDVHIVDPGNETVFTSHGKPRGQTARYNPLDEAQRGDETFMYNVIDSLVHVLMPTNPKLSDPFWEESGRGWLRAVMLHVMTAEPHQHRNLPHVRQLIKGGDPDAMARVNQELTQAGLDPITDPYRALIGVMKANTAYSNEISIAADAMEAILDTGTGRSIRAVIVAALEWIGKPDITHVLGASTFSLFDLKRKPTTIYVSMATYRLHQADRALLAMILQLANMIIERERETLPKHRVLFVIDEFSNIGYYKAIEDAFSLMRGFGLSINAVIQDLDQLQREYQGALETLTASCEVIQMFATNNRRTAQWMSEQLGGLMSADQILRLPRSERKQLVFVGGEHKQALVLDSIRYDEIFSKRDYDRDSANPRSR